MKGDFFVSDIDEDILLQYDIDINKTFKGRGALMCQSGENFYKLLAYNGTVCRAKFIEELQKSLRDSGFYYLDSFVRNKDGDIISTNEYQESYVLKEWPMGNECDVRNQKNVISGVETLAVLHNIFSRLSFVNDGIIPETPNVIWEYERHNKELKAIRNFMRKRHTRSSFEYDVLDHFDEYYGIAVDALDKIKSSGYEEIEKMSKEKKLFCHGNYNYHNIIVINEGKSVSYEKIAVVGFEKAGVGMQINDLYFYLRKVMEKHNWNIELGINIIEHYRRIRPISKDEMRILVIMLEYPEKFWKIVNQYYNKNKCWIPEKNLEKLKAVYTQQKKKEIFLKKIINI